MRTVCLLILSLAMSATAHMVWAATPAPSWSLLPQPAEMHPAAKGAVTVSDGDHVLVQAAGDAQALAVVQRFAALVAATRGLHLGVETQADKQSPAAIVFRMDPHADVANDAGYRIAIGEGDIDVTARTSRGLFYGGATVWQLLTPDGARDAPAQVANGTIVDHPRFAWRGLMLDSARHFQNVADIKKLIDWMSLNKLNVLHWHLTDDQGWRLEIPKYPELAKIGACRKAVGPDAALTGGPDKPYCGFYTDAEVRDIVRAGLDAIAPDGKRILFIIPDGTRTMPMPRMFELFREHLAQRARAFDFLIALGTHQPMDDAALSAHLGVAVKDGAAGAARVFNHAWDDAATFTPRVSSSPCTRR